MKRRSASPLIFSIAVHAVVAVAILSAAFHYDFSNEPNHPRSVPVQERVAFVRVAPMGGVTGGSDSTSAPARSRTPARGLTAPTAVPTSIPAAPAQASGVAGGVEGGKGVAGVSPAEGVVPFQADPRLTTDPHEFYPLPKTHAERVDSAVRASIDSYNDSVATAMANRGREPGDWTFEKNGQKWGMDGSKIYLGKFAIPTAVLAALPIRLQGNPTAGPGDRLASTRRGDIMIHADAAARGDEFKDAVKRIRERKDKERAERQDGPKAVPVVLIP